MKIPHLKSNVIADLNNLMNYNSEDARPYTLVHAETVQDWMLVHLRGVSLKFRLLNLSGDSVKYSRFLNMNADIIKLLIEANDAEVKNFLAEGVDSLVNTLRASKEVFATLENSTTSMADLEAKLEKELASALVAQDDNYFDAFGALIDNMVSTKQNDLGYQRLQKYLGGAGNRALISAILSMIAQARFMISSNDAIQHWLNGNISNNDSFDSMCRKIQSINTMELLFY